MAVSFEKSTLRIQVARQLAGRIERLGLKPGDVLGTEAALADELGLSVRTVREAAGTLKALGMLSSRRRVGLIVTQPDPAQNLSTIFPLYSQSPENMEDLGRLRYVIEMGALDLAVKNITDSQLDKMQHLVDQMNELWSQRRWREADRCDEQFHSLILEATGSKLVSSLHNVITVFFRKRAESTPYDKLIRYDHHGIYKAFRARDVEKLRSLFAFHLTDASQPTT